MTNPPINPKFINTAIDWNGNKCMIIVVGRINIRSNKAPNLSSLLNNKNPTPAIRHRIAPINKTTDKGFGIPWFEIEFTNKGNLKILGGIATAKVVARSNLPMKSKVLREEKFINQ